MIATFSELGLAHRALFKVRFKISILNRLRTFYYRLLGMNIGRGTTLRPLYVTWPHQVSLGDNCRLEHNIYFHYDGMYKSGPSIQIGNQVFIGAAVEFNCTDKITVEDNCLIASGTRFIDHNHGLINPEYPSNRFPDTKAAIHIAQHVWIGANCVILKGVCIGHGATIAAGAVVNHNIPPGEVWGGVPARKIGPRS
jgi:acetyltransferase-like isoleucine patch superfamily enzyme